MIEDELIDCVAGEIAVPDRRADLLQARPGIGQRDAGAAGAEDAQSDDAVGREPWFGAQCGERGRGIGDQSRWHAARRQAGLSEKLLAQRGELTLGPLTR